MRDGNIIAERLNHAGDNKPLIGIFDATDPKHPVLVSTGSAGFSGSAAPTSISLRAGLAIGGRRFIFSNMSLSGKDVLMLVDALDPKNPTFSPVAINYTPQDLAQSGDIFISAEANAGVSFYRIAPRTDVPDFTASFIQHNDATFPASVRLSALIQNIGPVASPSTINVAFYNGDPAAGGKLIGTGKTTKALVPNDSERVEISWLNPPPVCTL